ncbi:hypothetical protein GCM10011390_17330 [Aureimonas endophytica]|uniref:SapC protein n=1 Tax=Aureimonas endophytica TaxID=2027858 RepID=A0A916ZIX2_9HYPH|nr:SapC family protein [Aureimonas endophytica]GGD99080.1 hypothetical protein GCM10011390_17330 [Aureimonas endophytica]
MSEAGPVPLASLADRRLEPLARFDFAPRLGWIALNDTEFHLSAQHLPLALRLVGGLPRLGAVLDPSLLAKPQVGGEGRWLAPYLPIALRTFPFVLAGRPSERPIDEILVLPGTRRIGTRGQPICLDPATGTLAPEMQAIRNTLHMLRKGGERLTRALDLLGIAGILAPLGRPGGEATPFLTIDPERFAALDPGAVAALAHESFLPLDLATAILFSRRALAPGCAALQPASGAAETQTGAPRADPLDFMFANLETLNFALDPSDLFEADPAEVDWHDLAPPPLPAMRHVEGFAP